MLGKCLHSVTCNIILNNRHCQRINTCFGTRILEQLIQQNISISIYTGLKKKKSNPCKWTPFFTIPKKLGIRWFLTKLCQLDSQFNYVGHILYSQYQCTTLRTHLQCSPLLVPAYLCLRINLVAKELKLGRYDDAYVRPKPYH